MTPTRIRPGWTLAVGSVAAFLTALDGSIVTIALPTIRRALGGTVGQLEWTLNAYNLALACLLIAAAALGDRFGRRRILIVGLVGFALASASAALAPDIGWFIAARAVQGASAAAILPLTLTLIGEAYPPETRVRAIGVWGGVLGSGGVLGPLVGGALLPVVGWQGLFWVVVPIAGAAAIAARLLVAESRGGRAALDGTGLALSASGLLLVTWGLVQAADRDWADAGVWVPFTAGLALLAVFVIVERRRPSPLVPMGLFRSAGFRVAVILGLAIYTSLSAGVFVMAQYFQIVQHASPLVAAAWFVPWPAPVLLLSPVAGALAARWGERILLVAGMVMHTTGLVWFALVVKPSAPYAALVGPLILSGIGLACAFPTCSSLAVSSVPRERMGMASGVFGSMRQLGGVLGVAVAALSVGMAGGYRTPAVFATGFVDTMWACALIAGLGAVVAAAYAMRTGLRMAPVVAALQPVPHPVVAVASPAGGSSGVRAPGARRRTRGTAGSGAPGSRRAPR